MAIVLAEVAAALEPIAIASVLGVEPEATVVAEPPIAIELSSPVALKEPSAIDSLPPEVEEYPRAVEFNPVAEAL